MLGNGAISTVSNYKALSAILDYYLSHNGPESSTTDDNSVTQTDDADSTFSSYQHVDQNGSKEEIYLVTQSSVEHLVRQIQNHDTQCSSHMKIIRGEWFAHTGKFHLILRITADLVHEQPPQELMAGHFWLISE